MSTSVSILICTHNRANVLRDTLESLSRVRFPSDVSFEVVLVTNACTDDTAGVVAWALKHMPIPVVHVDEPRLGVAIARNRSLGAASGEILASIDDDVYLPDDWAMTLIAAFRDLKADIVGGRVELAWEGETPGWFMEGYLWLLSGCVKGEQTYRMHESSGAIGANFSFHRRVPELIGTFREDLGRIGRRLLAGEETEFVERALAAGLRAYHVPANKVRHRVPPHRSTPDYLTAAIHGWAMSNARYGKPKSAGHLTRSIFGNLILWIAYSVRQVLALVRGDNLMKISFRVKAACARGTVWGSLLFLLNQGRTDEAEKATVAAVRNAPLKIVPLDPAPSKRPAA